MTRRTFFYKQFMCQNKLYHLSKRLPKSTYEDNDHTDGNTNKSYYLDIQEDADQSLPHIINTPIQTELTTKLRKKRDSLSKSSRRSNYSYSIDTSQNISIAASPSNEYDNIYSSKAAPSKRKLQHKIVVKENRTLPKNISESKFNVIKIPLKLEQI